MIEKITHHRHATLHPLAATTKLRVVELSHRSIAVVHRNQHMRRRIGGEAMTLGKGLDELVSGGRQIGHDEMALLNEKLN